jgi:hypothetical protein
MSSLWERVLKLPSVALVLVALAALPALAQASLPDPTWIPGIYDEADSDDLIALVSSNPGGITVAPTELRPAAHVIDQVQPSGDLVALTPPAFPRHSRAPPAP